MQLIGMLDSPYVRRVAICLKLLKLDVEQCSISVFRGFDAFQAINPVVKAPTLVFDDGQALMDSSVILDYLLTLETAGRLPVQTDAGLRLREARLTGLALAANEKTMQIVYERNLRPEEKQHAPWLERVTGQLLAAYRLLEVEMAKAPLSAAAGEIGQAGVTVAVAWVFAQMMLPEVVFAGDYPALAAFSAAAEQLPEFLSTPPD